MLALASAANASKDKTPLLARAEDVWYRATLSGQPSGWTHEQRDTDPGGGYIERTETLLRFSRLGTEVTLWNRSEEWVDPERGLFELRFESAESASRDTLRIFCAVGRDSLDITRRMGSDERRMALVLPEDLLPSEEVKRRLLASPPEEFEFQTFSPDLERFVKITMTPDGSDTLHFSSPEDRTHTLTGHPCTIWRVECSATPGFESREWYDANGLRLRTETPILDLFEELSTEAAAREYSPGVEVLATTLVPLTPPLPHLERYERIEFRVGGARHPFEFLAHPACRVRTPVDGSGACILEVRAVRPHDAAEENEASRPDAALTEATSLVESDDPLLARAAASASLGATSDWDRAQRLTHYVYERIERKTTGVAFASARQTFDARSGDCTEHALLLTALCRATGVPARLVAGLIAIDDAMGYHLWTEIWDGAQWIGIDGTFDRAPIDARYLPLGISELREGFPIELVGQILPSLGRLRVEWLVVRAEDGSILATREFLPENRDSKEGEQR